MIVEYGSIYLVNFDPSIGTEYQKVRPALVVQANGITGHSSLATIIPISSRIESRSMHDIFLAKDDLNRLLHDSLLKVHQISSFDKLRFIHRIGTVQISIMDAVRAYLKIHFAL